MSNKTFKGKAGDSTLEKKPAGDQKIVVCRSETKDSLLKTEIPRRRFLKGTYIRD